MMMAHPELLGTHYVEKVLEYAGYKDARLQPGPSLCRSKTRTAAIKQQRPGAVQRGTFREIEAPEPSCMAAKPAIIIYGKRVGTTITVCTENGCPVHDPAPQPKPQPRPQKWKPCRRPKPQTGRRPRTGGTQKGAPAGAGTTHRRTTAAVRARTSRVRGGADPQG